MDRTIGPGVIDGPDRTNYSVRSSSVQVRSVSVGLGSVWTGFDHPWVTELDEFRRTYIQNAISAVDELDKNGIDKTLVNELKKHLLKVRKDASGRIHNKTFAKMNDFVPLAVCPYEGS